MWLWAHGPPPSQLYCIPTRNGCCPAVPQPGASPPVPTPTRCGDSRSMQIVKLFALNFCLNFHAFWSLADFMKLAKVNREKKKTHREKEGESSSAAMGMGRRSCRGNVQSSAFLERDVFLLAARGGPGGAPPQLLPHQIKRLPGAWAPPFQCEVPCTPLVCLLLGGPRIEKATGFCFSPFFQMVTQRSDAIFFYP